MNYLRCTQRLRRLWAASALAAVVAGALPAQAGFFGGQTPTYNIPIPGTNSGGETPQPEPTPNPPVIPIPETPPPPVVDPPGNPPPPVVDPPPPAVDPPPPSNETPEPGTILLGLTAVGLSGAYRLRRKK